LVFKDVDLTGATVYFTVKSDYDDDETDSTALIKKDITTHTSPLEGKTELILSGVDTNIPAEEYGYEIKLKKANGAKKTIEIGRFVVKDTYQRRD
jgi:hypothetical protein